MILKDKTILIMGLRNKWSIAYGVAKSAYEQGAKLAFTYVGEENKEKIEELISEFEGAKAYTCNEASVDEVVKETLTKVKNDFGKIDGILHAIAHANTEDLKNDFINTSKEGFAHANDVSAYSFVAISRIAKEIDLLTYFINNNPSELVKKGANTYSLKSHDSVIISNGLWHRFSTNEAGKSAVDYLIKVEKMTLQDAVSSVLNRNIDTYIRPQYSNESTSKTIVIPERASTNKQVIEYLKNRGIDEEIIKDCINKKIIYQENKTNNVVFLGYDNDNNIKYAGCRSTNEKRIMRDAKGSSKEYSFRMLGANECNSLHIFESSIDLLSYATLLKNKGYDYKNQNLLSLAGVYQPSSNIEQSKVPIAVQNFLNKNTNIRDIVLHFDNDLAGRNATKAMIFALDSYNVYDIPAPYGKDINDYLCYSIGLKNRQEIDKYKKKKEQNRVPI